MSSPNVSVTIEPSTGESVIYQILAKEERNSIHRVKIGFLVIIKNNDPITDIFLSKIKIIFKNSPGAQELSFEYDASLIINNGGTGIWEMQGASLEQGGQYIILPEIPIPAASLTLILNFQLVDIAAAGGGLDIGSVSVIKSLTSHVPPPGIGLGYHFPGKSKDLLEGENWQSPDSHIGGGQEIFAHDLGVMKYNPSASNYFQWRLKVDEEGNIMDGTQNSHYRAWDRPVYAMADGKIIDFENDHEDNTPGTEIVEEDGKTHSNFVLVQHGNPDSDNSETVFYAHFKKGSIPGNIIKDANIKRGDLLGHVGNSGHSGEPHLHIGAFKTDGYLRPILFTNISILSYNEIINNPSAEWANSYGYGLPATWAAVYPRPVPPMSLRALLVARGISFPASISTIAQIPPVGLSPPISIREFMKRIAV